MCCRAGVIDEHVPLFAGASGMTDKGDDNEPSAAGVTSYMEMPTPCPPLRQRPGRTSGAGKEKTCAVATPSISAQPTTAPNAPVKPTGAARHPNSSWGHRRATCSWTVARALKRVFSYCPARHSIVSLRGRHAPHQQACDWPKGAMARSPWSTVEIRSEEALCSVHRLALQLATEGRGKTPWSISPPPAELEMIAAHGDANITAKAVTALALHGQGLPATGHPHQMQPCRQDCPRPRDLDRRTDRRTHPHHRHRPRPSPTLTKKGGCLRAASGMPMVQFSLVAMLGLVDAGRITIEQLVALMAHHPANTSTSKAVFCAQATMPTLPSCAPTVRGR